MFDFEEHKKKYFLWKAEKQLATEQLNKLRQANPKPSKSKKKLIEIAERRVALASEYMAHHTAIANKYLGQ